jgi:hypothetical protein
LQELSEKENDSVRCQHQRPQKINKRNLKFNPSGLEDEEKKSRGMTPIE